MTGPGTDGDPQTTDDVLDDEGPSVALQSPGPRLRFPAGRFQPDPELRGEPLPPGYRLAHLAGAVLLVALAVAMVAVVVGLGLPGLVGDAALWFVRLLPFVS